MVAIAIAIVIAIVDRAGCSIAIVLVDGDVMWCGDGVG